MDGPWWLVAIAAVVGIYWGWMAYLHHRYPVNEPFDET